jgi:hypothetical protein
LIDINLLRQYHKKITININDVRIGQNGLKARTSKGTAGSNPINGTFCIPENKLNETLEFGGIEPNPIQKPNSTWNTMKKLEGNKVVRKCLNLEVKVIPPTEGKKMKK